MTGRGDAVGSGVGSGVDPAEVAAEVTGSRAVAVRRIGDAAHEVDLADGDLVVVKANRVARAEAAGLEWLAEPEGPPVPGVRGCSDGWLVIDQVEPGRPSPGAAEEFGGRLAALHATGAPAFGSPPPGGPAEATIGLAPMANAEADAWPDWFAEHRIARYARLAVDAGNLTAAEAAVVESVRVRAPSEPPARLHGDLWSGNAHWAADGRVWLIDPAAHGGHRESDLAMLALFGCPHLDRVLAAYHEAAPLADGWRERVPLHQLFPLLVHVVLFGRAYAARTVAAARSAPR
ncbi:fructosamine kinase family protein [Actinosynnema pretiosum subsp. pretiosum]|uniref:Fructosamine kinase family protein n=1 Tax=Actinosynnema pretiosum subsp. pretiosum TaxID=103721 RepID=A0AA45R6U9_9PSEU|nr:Ribulosamine/erythrulosamine 3-kinase potentially involved in protein deglycation [Actinosynnema pretiosum subsp. pretiosum]QUF07426.1 fructosamine kinase family protein [Actinosynnema pretiosum subsp. pretiosum]